MTPPTDEEIHQFINQQVEIREAESEPTQQQEAQEYSLDQEVSDFSLSED